MKQFLYTFLSVLLVSAGMSGIDLAYADKQAVILVESVVLRPLQAAEVPSQQTGLLELIEVEEGQVVKKGQVLASLDDREAMLEVAKAKLQAVQAEAKAENLVRAQYAQKALEVARAELKRSQESIEKFTNSISQ